MFPSQHEPATENHFSFYDPLHRASEDTDWSNATELGMQNADICGTTEGPKLDVRTPWDCRGNGSPCKAKLQQAAKDVDDEKGVASRPSRKNACSPIGHHGRQLCPTSREQAIARYRQEMLEMVSDMPELSLRDLAEFRWSPSPGQETPRKGREPSEDALERKKDQKKLEKVARRLTKSESMDRVGFFPKFSPKFLVGRRLASSTSADGGKNELKRRVASERLTYKIGEMSSNSADRSSHINRYRQEMLEMIKGMPESTYELTLRDLVELPSTPNVGQETPAKGRDPSEDKLEKEQKKLKKEERRASRSESMDIVSFILKKLLPKSLRSRSSSVTSTSTHRENGRFEKNADSGRWMITEFSELSKNNTDESSSHRSRRMRSWHSLFQNKKDKRREQ